MPSLVGFALAAVTVRATADPLIAALKRRNIVRPDAHKPGNPMVVHSGGTILFTGFSLGLTSALLLAGDANVRVKALVVFSSAAICFLVGLVDDIKVLKGQVKTALTILSVLPIAVAGMLAPNLIKWGRPTLPLVGSLRITVIYWLLLPLSVAGAANVVNMLDVMNGVVPGTSIVAFLALAAAGLLLGRETTVLVSMVALGALMAYYMYNAYPARVFNGDSGSLFIGALIGALAVADHLEFVALTLLLPHIINGFFVLVSFRGFREHREVKTRPILVSEDGILSANRDANAPLSLTRLILAVGGPSREREIAQTYIAVEAIAAALALVSALLMR